MVFISYVFFWDTGEAKQVFKEGNVIPMQNQAGVASSSNMEVARLFDSCTVNHLRKMKESIRVLHTHWTGGSTSHIA